MELPQGMFGISLATYLLTTLSGWRRKKLFRIPRHAPAGYWHAAVCECDCGILLVVLAEPIIRLFEHGKFTADSTGRATLALMCLARGWSRFNRQHRGAGLFALGDTKSQ